MYQTSARFDVVILITLTLTDSRRSKNIQKNLKLFGKLEFFLNKIRIFYVENTHTCRFLINLYFKPAMTSKF